MIFNDLLSVTILIGLIFIVPVLLSLPAIIILNRNRCFFLIDYGLNTYSLCFFSFLAYFFKPITGSEGISMFIVDIFFLTIFSIILNYIKLLFINKSVSKYISISTILIMLIVTAGTFFFTPVFGE